MHRSLIAHPRCRRRLLAQNVPWNVWTKLLAENRVAALFCHALNCWAVLRRYSAVLHKPWPNTPVITESESAGKRGLAPYDLNGAGEGFFFRRSNCCHARSLLAVDGCRQLAVVGLYRAVVTLNR